MKNGSLIFAVAAVAISAFIALPGCATQQPMVVSAAAPVQVVDATIPQNVLTQEHCQLKGQVLARTVLAAKPDSLFISQEELSVIKSKAAVLGADSVVIRDNQMTYENGQYVHVINSDAYACQIPTYRTY